METSWSNLRFALRRRDDGLFEFVEQRLDEAVWSDNFRSGLYQDAESAERDVIAYAAEYETR
jgi:hypothetical protein